MAVSLYRCNSATRTLQRRLSTRAVSAVATLLAPSEVVIDLFLHSLECTTTVAYRWPHFIVVVGVGAFDVQRPLLLRFVESLLLAVMFASVLLGLVCVHMAHHALLNSS